MGAILRDRRLRDRGRGTMNLREHSFLSIFEASSADRLMAHCQILEVGDTGVIFREGDPGDALFLVLEGTVTLSTNASGHREFLVTRQGISLP